MNMNTTATELSLLTNISKMHIVINAQAAWLNVLQGHIKNFTVLSSEGNNAQYTDLAADMSTSLENLGMGHNFIATQSNDMHMGMLSLRDGNPELHSFLCTKELADANEKLAQTQLQKNEAKAALDSAEEDTALVKAYFNAINGFKHANATLISIQEKCAEVLPVGSVNGEVDSVIPYAEEIAHSGDIAAEVIIPVEGI